MLSSVELEIRPQAVIVRKGHRLLVCGLDVHLRIVGPAMVSFPSQARCRHCSTGKGESSGNNRPGRTEYFTTSLAEVEEGPILLTNVDGIKNEELNELNKCGSSDKNLTNVRPPSQLEESLRVL